jgi:hypothetical protein
MCLVRSKEDGRTEGTKLPLGTVEVVNCGTLLLAARYKKLQETKLAYNDGSLGQMLKLVDGASGTQALGA